MLMLLEAVDANDPASSAYSRKGRWHLSCLAKLEPRKAMTKSLEVISEAIRNPKHPFRKVDNQPKKTLKHRYERRKIKGYLHLEDWMSNEGMANEAT
jgi:hypothetical protein